MFKIFFKNNKRNTYKDWLGMLLIYYTYDNSNFYFWSLTSAGSYVYKSMFKVNGVDCSRQTYTLCRHGGPQPIGIVRAQDVSSYRKHSVVVTHTYSSQATGIPALAHWAPPLHDTRGCRHRRPKVRR